MNIIELADRIAEEGHKGQFRNGGVIPYITHPRAVRAKVAYWWQQYVDYVAVAGIPNTKIFSLITKAENYYFDSFGFDPSETQQIAEATSVIHDVLEDTEWTKKELSSDQHYLEPKDWVLWSETIHAVIAITKNPEKGAESYLDYLKRVKANPIARIVKLADLWHNMSDLKPGNMLDKYLLAEEFLLN